MARRKRQRVTPDNANRPRLLLNDSIVPDKRTYNPIIDDPDIFIRRVIHYPAHVVHQIKKRTIGTKRARRWRLLALAPPLQELYRRKVCFERAVRRQVLFAYDKMRGGSGKSRPRRRTEDTRIKCKRR